MTTPTSLADAVITTTGTTYATTAVAPSPGTLLLVIMSGTTATATPPTSVTGLGLDWTNLGSDATPNSRITCSIWAATGTPTPGAATITFPTQQARIAYRLTHTTATIRQSAAGSSGAAEVSAPLPDAPLPDSSVFAAIAINSTALTLTGDQGQTAAHPDLTFSSPVGRLLALQQDTPTQAQDYRTGTTFVGKVAVTVELEPAPEPPPPSTRIYIVSNGIELPATITLVRDGIEHTAIIDDPPPAPMPTKTMLIGAAVSPRQDDVEAFEAQVGELHVLRSFDTGFPATWAQGNAGWHPDRMVSWHSIKPDVAQTASGALDNALAAWVGSIPASHRCMLTFQHEPENPNKGINPAQWRTASRRFYDIVKSIRPDIPVGPILMGWTMNPQSGRNPDDWDPGADKVDFYGVDAYQAYLFPPSGSPTGWTAAPHPEMVTQVTRAAQRDRPAAVGETACGDYQGDFVRKRDWIKAGVDLMAANDAIAFCYFNTMVNHDMSPNSLITDDPLTQGYFSDLLANPPVIH